jgi:hypothetical protein
MAMITTVAPALATLNDDLLPGRTELPNGRTTGSGPGRLATPEPAGAQVRG